MPSSESEASTSASSAAQSNSSPVEADQRNSVIDVDAHAIVPSTKTLDPKPTAATSGAVEGDWLQPPPGDWGGTVDRQAIKEPDSSGVLFFFIIIAALSLGVHQLLRLIGARRGEEQLARQPTAQVAVVAAPASRATLPQPTSKPEASAEASAPSTSAAASLAEAPERSAMESGAGDGAARRSPQAADASDVAATASATQRGPEGGGGRGSAGPSSALVSASDTEADVESDDTAAEQSEPAAMRPLQQQAASGPASKASLSVPFAGPTEGDQASSSAAAKVLQQVPEGEGGAGSAVGGAGARHEEAQIRSEMPGLTIQAPSRAAGPSGQGSAADGAAGPVGQPLIASTSTAGGSGVLRSVPGRTPVPAEQASPGPGPSADAAGGPTARSASPFSGASAFFMGSSGGGGGGLPTAVQPESAAPARLPLPSVRPEPLSRAPDSSALAMLPNDSSLGSLRERAHLSLRAAASAVEASQRAAAYAAAASSAASRAADAAERAAAAATSAQVGLENAAESAIVAAEVRVSQAAEAAKEAEGRAASAAAHATAYQDIAQSQADIAERAAAVHKPATVGPLGQLQQLWRSASSAFVSGHQQSQEGGARGGQGDGPLTTGAAGGGGATSSSSSSGDSGARGNSNNSACDVVGTGAPAGNMGTAAAETISSTVKGLLSWLGHGDGTR